MSRIVSMSSSNLEELECSACGKKYDAEVEQHLCTCGKPLLARYDLRHDAGDSCEAPRRGDALRDELPGKSLRERRRVEPDGIVQGAGDDGGGDACEEPGSKSFGCAYCGKCGRRA